MSHARFPFFLVALACFSINADISHAVTYVTNPGDQSLIVEKDQEGNIISVTNPGTLRSAIQTIEDGLTTPPISIKSTAEAIYLTKPLPDIFTDLTIESSQSGSSRSINKSSEADPIGYLEIGGGQTTTTFDIILNRVNVDISGSATLVFQGLGNTSLFDLSFYGGDVDFNFSKQQARVETYAGMINLFYNSEVRISSSYYNSPVLKLTGDIKDYNIYNPLYFNGEGAVNGSIILSGNNSWLGGSIINQVEVSVLSSNSFPKEGTVLYKQGGRLVFNLPQDDIWASSGSMIGLGSLIINQGNLQISGGLVGIAVSIQNGSLALSGTNTLNAVLLKSGGTLEVSSFQNLGRAAISLAGGTLHVLDDVILKPTQIFQVKEDGSSINVDQDKTISIPSLEAALASNTQGTLTLSGEGSHVIKQVVFDDVDGTVLTISGELKGTFGLQITDENRTNTLALAGVNSYLGETVINSGTLLLKAETALYQLDSGTVSVEDFAVLQGEDLSAYIDGDISLRGTLRGKLTVFGFVDCLGEEVTRSLIYPGNSRGEILLGDVNFGSYSDLDIYVDSTGSSLLSVVDSLVIEEGSILSFDVAPEFIEPGMVDTFLSWGTRSGKFLKMKIPSVWLNGHVHYEENEANITWGYNSLAKIAKKGNAHRVGQAIDKLVAKDDMSFLSSLGFLIPATREEIVLTLNQMQPSLFKAAVLVQQNNVVKVQDTVTLRMQKILDTRHCYQVKPKDGEVKDGSCHIQTTPFHIWMDGLGDALSQESVHYASSPQVAYSENMGGFVSGIDYHFLEQFYVGVLGGYTRADLHFSEDQGKGRIKSGYAGLYFSAIGEMFYGNVSVIENWNGFHEYRHLLFPDNTLTASNRHGGRQLLSHIDTGINLGWKGFTIRPFDSLDYIATKEDSFRETGAGTFDLFTYKSNAIMLRNELGLNFSGCFCVFATTWTLSPKISWVRETRIKGSSYKTEFVGTGVPFHVTGYLPSRSLVSPGVTLTSSMLNDFLTATLYYNGEFAGGYSDHSYGGELRFGF